MIQFKAVLKKFDRQGEKTGWTYFEIPTRIAVKLKPGTKTSFRVRGKIDAYKIKGVSLLPMGEGNFIMPVNASMRRGIGKRQGAKIIVTLEADDAPFKMSSDFIDCLADEPKALSFFKTLPGSHQRYFSKWIDSAKTEVTKAKRIAKAVNALARKMGFAEMMREKV